MPMSHFSKLFGTKDAKIAKMTADPAGGASTYAASVDVPGIKFARIEGDVETKQLRGDHSKLDSDSTLTNLTVTFGYAKLSLDAQAVMVGGTVVDSGVTPNQLASWELLGTDPLFPNFRFEAQVHSVDAVAGDGHLSLWKCQINAFPPIGTEEEDYSTFEVGADASPRNADSKWIKVAFHETALALA